MTPQHRGAGFNLVPELEVRQLVLVGLAELAGNDAELTAILRRTDNLRDGSQTDWAAELRAELLAMLDPNSDRCVVVKLGYPTATAHLPCVSIVLDGSNEDTGEAVAGDVLGIAHEIIGAVPPAPATLQSGLQLDPLPGSSPVAATHRVHRITTVGTGWNGSVQVGCWALSPEASLLLQAAVRWAVFRRKGDLGRAGVHNITLQEGGVVPDERLEPRVGYVPMITVSMDWTYRQTRRSSPRPTGVNLRPGTPLNNPC